MKKYRIDSDTWSNRELDDLKSALEQYEFVKDLKMGDGVSEDSYIELVCSENNFENYEVIKRAEVVVDKEKMAICTPREEGYDWDYWAKWREIDNGELSKIGNT